MAKKSRSLARERRHVRVRKHVSGTASRPRLNVFKSLTSIYAQIIDDVQGNTLVSATTSPHESLGKIGGAKVFLKPASAGTGVIAAGGVRAVLELAGVRDILTKSMGSANVLNVVMATFGALDGLRSPAIEAARRGKRVEELVPFWERRKQHA